MNLVELVKEETGVNILEVLGTGGIIYQSIKRTFEQREAELQKRIDELENHAKKSHILFHAYRNDPGTIGHKAYERSCKLLNK